MAVYKVLLTLLWLTIPAAAVYLLYTDYQEYLSAGEQQRRDCQARIDTLGRYSQLALFHAHRVAGIIDADTRVEWQQGWSGVTRELERIQLTQRLTEPTHYPNTDRELLMLEQLLRQQTTAVDLAGREQDAYNKAGGGLDELQNEIIHASVIADYYRSIGAGGIADLIDLDVAAMDEELRNRLRQRQRLAREVEQALDDAEQLRDSISAGLNTLTGCLQQDETQTYQQALVTRYFRFNLRLELRALFGPPAGSGSTGS